jgi:hypothetical protein
MGDTGLEDTAKSSGNTHDSLAGGNNSGNKGETSPPSTSGATPFDPDLAALITAWPTVTPAVRAGILAMVKAVSSGIRSWR